LIDIDNRNPTLAQILLIEDHADTVYMMIRCLECHGFSVSSATSGKAALVLVKKRLFSAIVSDFGLPDIDGRRLLPLLREHSSAPAVAVTACAFPSDVVESAAVGFVEHLGKPVDVEKLVVVLRRLIWPAPPFDELGRDWAVPK
jgi:two-component system CheB/CheR fusion protein